MSHLYVFPIHWLNLINFIFQGRATKKKPSTSGINWDVEREAGLKMLLHIVSLNLQRLWDPPIAEEEFVK